MLVSFMLAMGISTLGKDLPAQDNALATPTVREAVGFAVSPRLRELVKLPHPPQYAVYGVGGIRPIPKHDSGATVDPVEQNFATAFPTVDYNIGLNFFGFGYGFPGYQQADAFPDTNLAVGDTQVVQWSNLSFTVLNKFDGSLIAGPIEGDSLFAALGGPCAAQSGENFIIQWDNAAHRWLLAQNVYQGPPYYACVAVSTSADAQGPYYLYQFSLGDGFPDYPKWGRWINSWAQTVNNFGSDGNTFMGPEVCMYERSRLLAGTPQPRQVCFQLHISSQCTTQHIGCQDSLLPADIDSTTNPPAAEDQFFIGSVADVNNTHLSLYSVHIDWLHPSQATITGDNNSQLTLVPAYSLLCSGPLDPCVPQPGSADVISLDDRLMYRFAYYNDAVGGKQHWYVNHSVRASSAQLGVRWYEFQAPQIAIMPSALLHGPFQSGTWAPDANWRWMGSIAADRNNDILVGYSLSNTTVNPSIEVAGRLPSTPSGTLEPEISVLAGTGSQPNSNPGWGTFSSMRLDPDGCTFWYAQEYYQASPAIDWSTQIASVRFANCRNPAYNGYIELCKQTDPDYPVTGTFNFTLTAPFFNGGPYAVPVGTCSPAISVPSGEITVAEAPMSGVAVENVTAYSYDAYGNYINELDSWTPPNLSATVSVVPGGVSLETVATFTNYAAPLGTLKICKIAGSGVMVNTPFHFMVTDGKTQRMDDVEAGPAPGGYCTIDGTWPVNDPVTITEVNIPTGVSVTSITVSQGQLSQCTPPASNCAIATIGSGITEVSFTDSELLQACSGQTLITIDPDHNTGYVPIYTTSTNGDGQIEVVDLTVGSPHPLIATITLPGSARPLATVYNPANHTILAEASQRAQANSIAVYEIDTTAHSVLYKVPTPKITVGSAWGGMIEDTTHNRAFVAGQFTVGILDTSTSPPTWNPASVISTSLGAGYGGSAFDGATDSMALNLNTGWLFISGDGYYGCNEVIDTTQTPLKAVTFSCPSSIGITDGVAFDPSTNILLLSTEGQGSNDEGFAFNFADLNYNGSYYQANNIESPGMGFTSPWGEGPGGQTVIDCSTHRGVIVDEFGHNLKLLQLPSAPVPQQTPLDNNGNPCTTNHPDSASAYTIAATTIPQGLVNGQMVDLGAVGDPSSLTIDPIHNFAYMLGDPNPSQHKWGTSPPLFLIRVDLSSPTLGGGPTGGCNGQTYWNPVSSTIPMP